jgi:hypothetical protein
MERLSSLVTDSIFDNADDEITVIRDVPHLENENPEDDFLNIRVTVYSTISKRIN